jgi:hypothetical protein
MLFSDKSDSMSQLMPACASMCQHSYFCICSTCILINNMFWHCYRPSPPDTPEFGAINTTLSYSTTQPAAATAGAAYSSTRNSQQQQQQWQGAWQAPQQQLRRTGSSGGSISATVLSSGSLIDAAAAAGGSSQPVRIPEARVLPYR